MRVRVRPRRPAPARDRARPLYARVLGLRHINPSGTLCFVFVEGTIALAVLLALAEQVSWWGVVVLPLAVAAVVKFNDMIAGLLIPSRDRAGRSATRQRHPD